MKDFEDVVLITAPQLGVNDPMAEVKAWEVVDGGSVQAGQLICVLETTKAVYEVHADRSGLLVRLVPLNEHVRVSQPLALIGDDLAMLRRRQASIVAVSVRMPTDKARAGQEKRATERAITAARELGVDIEALSVRGIIREIDIQRYYATEKRHKPETVSLVRKSELEAVLVYGAGRGAVTVKECLDLGGEFEVVAFVDDNPAHPSTLCDVPVYHSSRLREIAAAGVAKGFSEIANGRFRVELVRRLKDYGVELINAIHPQSFISSSVMMGWGNYVKAGAILETNTVLGNACIIDNGVIVAHDSRIGDGCHLAPGATLGSSIQVGDFAVIGIGASIAADVAIGRSAIISPGSSVVRDVPDNTVIEGVPGRIIGRTKGPTSRAGRNEP